MTSLRGEAPGHVMAPFLMLVNTLRDPAFMGCPRMLGTGIPLWACPGGGAHFQMKQLNPESPETWFRSHSS